MIALRYFQPAPDLRPYVASYYVFRADVPWLADVVRADLAQIRFILSGQGCYHFVGAPGIPTPEVSLIGPTMAASRFEMTGPVLVFGAALLPAGWAAGVQEDASRLVHQVDDGAARFGRIMEDALDAMRAAPAPEVMVSIADAVLRAVFARAPEPPLWFTQLTESWLTDLSVASPSVDALIGRAGMSARQLSRLANRIYGAPPKLLARKYRALRAAVSLADPRLDWASAAGEAFYDQSHFIREVKLFTGLTPRQIRDNPTPVTRLMQQRRGFAAQMPKIAMVR